MNQALVKKVLADPATHRVVRVTAEADAPTMRAKVPALAVPTSGIA
jgi:UDP-3-O-[3-hydroxymyristoyl] N-acetylglucosamine deacetylase